MPPTGTRSSSGPLRGVVHKQPQRPENGHRYEDKDCLNPAVRLRFFVGEFHLDHVLGAVLQLLRPETLQAHWGGGGTDRVERRDAWEEGVASGRSTCRVRASAARQEIVEVEGDAPLTCQGDVINLRQKHQRRKIQEQSCVVRKNTAQKLLLR